MPSNNPTKTRGIEARWNKEINRRWGRFSMSITTELRRANKEAMVFNAIELNPAQTRTYMEFVKREIERLLLGAESPPNWQANYQVESYKRSLEQFSAELKRQGESTVATQLEIEDAANLRPLTATQSLGISAGGTTPIHRDALEFLTTRSYESLEGWTDALAREIRGTLVEGVSQGEGIEEIVKKIRERTSVSRSRARVIAQTETNQAYGVAQTNQAERASEELDEEVQLRWITVLDSKVRDLHAGWHGTVKDAKESRRRKGVSPWNCRCGLAPVVQGANTPAKKKKFKEERKELMERVGEAVKNNSADLNDEEIAEFYKINAEDTNGEN